MMTLASQGSILVTQAAARAYAAFAGLPMEEARRRLTELLLDARLRPDGTWRRRSRTDNVDISAHVVIEDGLVRVTHVGLRNLGSQRSERPNHGYPQK